MDGGHRKTGFRGDRIPEIGANSSEFLSWFAQVCHSNPSHPAGSLVQTQNPRYAYCAVVRGT